MRKFTFLLLSLIIIGTASAQFIQTDWSGGPGQPGTSTDLTKFNSSYQADFTSIPGDLIADNSQKTHIYGVVEYQGKLLVSTAWSGVFIYDPSTEEWEYSYVGATISYKNNTIHSDGKLYVINGYSIYSYDGTHNDYGLGANGWLFHSNIKSFIGDWPSTYTSIYSAQNKLMITGRIGYSGTVIKWNSTNNKWEKMGNSFTNGVMSLMEYNGTIFAGTHWAGNVYKWNGSSWIYAFDTPSMSIVDMEVHNNELYLAGRWDLGQGRLYKSNGYSATQIYYSSSGIYDLESHGDILVFDFMYTSPYRKIMQWDGNSASTLYDFNGEISSQQMCSFNGDLYYGGTWGTSTSTLYKNGQAFEKIYVKGVISSEFPTPNGLLNIDATTSDDNGVKIFVQGKNNPTYLASPWIEVLDGEAVPISDDIMRYWAILHTVGEGPSPTLHEISIGYQSVEPLTIDLISKTDISCFGDQTGAIDISVSGGTEPYSYLWSNGATTEDLNNLIAGTYAITVTDENANTVSAEYILTEPDALTISCPEDITVSSLENDCGAYVDFIVTTSGGINPELTFSHSSGDFFPIGTTEVTSTATDICENIQCTFNVTVVDDVSPTLTCVGVQEHCANIIGLNEYQVAGTDFDLIDMWDNCSIVSITNDFNGTNTLAGASFPTGTTLVTWTVTDPSGNATTCSFDVIINPLPIATITPSDVSMCCNELTLTATSSTSEGFYEWSNGETTQSIGLSIDDDLEGTYTVIVTDQNGCVSPYAASYDYIPENLASSYIILGFESALIGQNHLVKNGAVGSSYSDGKAHFLRYAEVNGNGAFVKAPKVIAHKTSILPEVIKEQATMALPEMLYNTTSKITKRVKIRNGTSETLSGANTNLTIGDNCNITLTGQVFGNIILGSGSSLTFTSGEIYIRNLQMNRANKGTPSYLVFETDAVVLVKEKVMLDSYCIVNPDHFKVIFYIGEEYDGHHGQLQVKSEGAEFNACAYVPRGQIHVQENPKSVDIGYMNGQFFAEKIIGNGKNVIWNWTGSGINTSNNESTKTLPVFESQTLTIYPSPNDGSFMLFVESDIEDNFKIRIFNQLGARVYEIDQFEIRTGNTKRYISIQDIVPGVYTVELINDETRLIQKMVVTN